MQNPTSLERIGVTAEDLENIEVSPQAFSQMYAITPVEGRYRRYVKNLSNLISEFEWSRRRIWIEIEYAISLSDFLNTSGTKKRIIVKRFSEDEKKVLRSLYNSFSPKDFLQIQLLDLKTNHDIVAMVRWTDYKLSQHNISIEEAIHFGRTSADINSNVYATIVRDIFEKEYLPQLIRLQQKLISLAKSHNTVFSGQTHGQYAEYTTLKKVFANHIDALAQAISPFIRQNGASKLKMTGKLGGAIGNNSDIKGAYPDLDWDSFNKDFIENTLSLKFLDMCDQDEFNIQFSEFFDILTRINDVIIKFAEDFWEYCSRGVFKKIVTKEESGSSVMAQKANPWRLEGGWEYLADADFSKYHNLTKYKRQGDLRRSIRKRTIGEPFAKIIIAFERILSELDLYEPDTGFLKQEADENISMSSAYIQTVLKREGLPEAYDLLKKMSMGKKPDLKMYYDFIDNLKEQNKITPKVCEEIKLGMLPENNTGDANMLADRAMARAEGQIEKIRDLYSINKY
ncbi:MAG: lyase family protein [archaeon]|nr:lyase family protein [archaeon]